MREPTFPPIPPPALSADRRRLNTETSASAGWAVRLAALFPDQAATAKPAAAAVASAPRPPARHFSACP